MLIDSHCHLIDKRYNKPPKQLIEEANGEGVEKFINVGTSIEDSKRAVKLAQEFDNVYATIGIYPHENKEMDISTLKRELEKLLQQGALAPCHNTASCIVAIGECGIDISNRKERSLAKQIELFEMQIQLALENDLPLAIHNRNGDTHIEETLKKYSGRLRGIMHCFSSNWEFAKKMLDLNFYISFSGTITYPTAKNLLEVVEKVPLAKFLVETDAPYLPPQSHRGKINEPKYVKIVAQKVAEIKGLPIEKVSACSYENACAVFRL